VVGYRTRWIIGHRLRELTRENSFTHQNEFRGGCREYWIRRGCSKSSV